MAYHNCSLCNAKQLLSTCRSRRVIRRQRRPPLTTQCNRKQSLSTHLIDSSRAIRQTTILWLIIHQNWRLVLRRTQCDTNANGILQFLGTLPNTFLKNRAERKPEETFGFESTTKSSGLSINSASFFNRYNKLQINKHQGFELVFQFINYSKGCVRLTIPQECEFPTAKFPWVLGELKGKST